MFTGLVQSLCRVRSVQSSSFGASLHIDIGPWSHRPSRGDSIAVNGCCLTVADDPAEGVLRFDVVRQTLSLTNLGALRDGDQVNLEHAAFPTTLLGGHIVQGHIDGVGVVLSNQGDRSQCTMRVEAPASLMDHIVERGSIAVNGVSLTLAMVGDKWFEVALIPTTLAMTNLGQLRAGQTVNLETDYIAKIVSNWLQRRSGG